jgi:trigger factor
MKVSVEDQSSVKKVMHIEIPEEDVVGKVNEAYKQLKKTAKVKGFRPGKAPRSVLERMYKKDVNKDVSSKLIQEAFIEALKQTELRIVGTPTVDPPELKYTGSYAFDAEVDVYPEIDDIDFKGFELEKTVYKASDEEVEAQLQMLRKNLTKMEPIEEERGAQEGDFLLLDYEGFKDGTSFEETQKTQNFTLKLGDAHVSKEFDDGLVGMKPEEDREIAVTFAEDYFNNKLAGEKVLFKVHLHDIRKEIIPEIDDEMAKQLGPFDSLEALKKQIVENLSQGYAKRSEQEVNEQIYTKLLEKTSFELPETLVKMELDHIVSEAERSFEYANKSMEEAGVTKEGLVEKYRETAEKQVRRHLLLGKIIEQEKLELPDEALDQGFQEMADNYQQPVDHIKNYYNQNPKGLELFKHTLLEKEAIRLIVDNSKITEIEPKKEPETEK